MAAEVVAKGVAAEAVRVRVAEEVMATEVGAAEGRVERAAAAAAVVVVVALAAAVVRCAYVGCGYAEREYDAESGCGDRGYAERGNDMESGYAERGYADRGYDMDRGYADCGYADCGYADRGYADCGYAERGYADRGYAMQVPHTCSSLGWRSCCVGKLFGTSSSPAGPRQSIPVAAFPHEISGPSWCTGTCLSLRPSHSRPGSTSFP